MKLHTKKATPIRERLLEVDYLDLPDLRLIGRFSGRMNTLHDQRRRHTLPIIDMTPTLIWKLDFST